MENLSPKKYIQTRARSLPLYKCYVSNNWEDAGMANVIVVRRHVNNKITAGLFLVDLKCLGIKDTSWHFNISEYELFENFTDFEENFSDVDYSLAHNIIFAGHDFAMEYDIAPHKDFAISKFILEEDDDEIPLIDIEVGENGIPHLITYNRGEHLDALAKLRKNAGEGNYYYTILEGGFEDDENLDEEGEENYIPLSDIEMGSLNPDNVEEVEFEDLINGELVSQRNEHEQLICHAEVYIRILDPVITPAEEELINKEWEYYNELDIEYTEKENALYEDCIDKIKSTLPLDNAEAKDERFRAEHENHSFFINIMRDSNDNPICVMLLNILGLIIKDVDENANVLVLEKMNGLKQHDIIQLSFALRELLTHSKKATYQSIVEQPGYNSIFSGKTENFQEDCLALYYMIQVIRYSRSNKIALAINYYQLLACSYEGVVFTFGSTLFYPIFLDALLENVQLKFPKVKSKNH